MKSIFITTNFVGFHRWPEAKSKRKYLANLHRHLFGVKVEVSVTENNRQIEFHDLKDVVNTIIEKFILIRKNDAMSCEDIAETILDYLELKYSKNMISVTVDEDGECGSSVNNHNRF